MRLYDEHTPPGMKAQIIQLEHAPARDGHANCTGGAPELVRTEKLLRLLLWLRWHEIAYYETTDPKQHEALFWYYVINQ